MAAWYNAPALGMKLLSVKAAQRRIATSLAPVQTERVPLERALGRVMAEAARSAVLPRFDNSSVDGFAVLASDVRGATQASPRRLRVAADVPAGRKSPVRVTAGRAARIMTGAPIPRGATAVVMLEDTDFAARPDQRELPPSVQVLRSVSRGENIRRRGMDVAGGRLVLLAGHTLRSQDLGLLAMLGRTRVRVFRRPRVALLASGNELTRRGRRLRPGQVIDVNSITLAALIEAAGCEVIGLGIARDTSNDIERLLRKAVQWNADLIVSSAGVSVGAFDLVRDVIMEGGRIDFWRVNVRPGKPLAVGEYRGIPFIGLPGNPVSAFVGFELFVRPAIARLSGAVLPRRRPVQVRLSKAIKLDGRESYLRAVITERRGNLFARLVSHQGSGNLLSLVQANALLLFPAGVKSLAAGDRVDAWWL